MNSLHFFCSELTLAFLTFIYENVMKWYTDMFYSVFIQVEVHEIKWIFYLTTVLKFISVLYYNQGQLTLFKILAGKTKKNPQTKWVKCTEIYYITWNKWNEVYVQKWNNENENLQRKMKHLQKNEKFTEKMKPSPTLQNTYPIFLS